MMGIGTRIELAQGFTLILAKPKPAKGWINTKENQEDLFKMLVERKEKS